MFKASLEAADLQRALKYVKPIAGRKSHMPVFNCVKLEARPGALEVTAYDGTTTVYMLVMADTGQCEPIIIPFKGLTAALPAKGHIKLDGKDLDLVVHYINSKAYVTGGIALNDYPKLQAPEIITSSSHNYTDQLRKALNKTLHAVSADEGRLGLNGLSFKKQKNFWRLCGTDGHRLSLMDLDFHVDGPAEEAIVPRTACLALQARLNDRKKGEAKLHLGIMFTSGVRARSATKTTPAVDRVPDWATFKLDGMSIVTQLVDDTFPDYTQVMPKPNDLAVKFKVDRKAWIKACAAVYKANVAVCKANRASGRNPPSAKHELTPTGLTLTSGDLKAKVPASLLGEPVEHLWGMNTQYIKQALESLGTKEVDCSLTHSKQSPLFVTEGSNHLQIIMPIRI